MAPRLLTKIEFEFLALENECPFCTGKTFRFGPRGGMSTNIFCAEPDGCGAGFNIAIGIIPEFAQLIKDPKV